MNLTHMSRAYGLFKETTKIQKDDGKAEEIYEKKLKMSKIKKQE